MKVYCCFCKYFEIDPMLKGKWPPLGGYQPKEEICSHFKNKAIVDTYKIPLVQYISRPSLINKNNDCSWFQEIPKKMSLWNKITNFINLSA